MQTLLHAPMGVVVQVSAPVQLVLACHEVSVQLAEDLGPSDRGHGVCHTKELGTEILRILLEGAAEDRDHLRGAAGKRSGVLVLHLSMILNM